ncbi:transporter substrate-binding domain-containing protein [Pelagibacterium sp. 26DY04]|uniref:substrate-binding periplasmic protein n=1 Tax=Pelagibacterium sp. 26DY04 TaxID=2967130 RepID=UPI0028157101|nr:transporter substrate-binding domain-containing protein [Pelagibacterium sp. 26DY04]WMT88560.1 transporter substrate-binding domain-containing protein [Pelagibacterium sp. 26DY04]
MPRLPIFFGVILIASSALAQPMVQRDFYEGAIRDRGNRIIFCIWPDSPMVDLDRAIASEIAGLHLLEAEFFEADQVSSGTQELFEQQLFIHLMDDCDAVMGTSLDWRPLPEWLTVTRSYFELGYVLATQEEGVTSPFDLPAGARVGSIMLSQADMTFARTLGGGADIIRIPYDTAENILAAIVGGQLEAGIVPIHALPLISGQFADEGIVVSRLTSPEIAAEPIGMALLSRDAYLRDLLGDAIAALQADGTMSALAVQMGYGIP